MTVTIWRTMVTTAIWLAAITAFYEISHIEHNAVSAITTKPSKGQLGQWYCGAHKPGGDR